MASGFSASGMCLGRTALHFKELCACDELCICRNKFPSLLQPHALLIFISRCWLLAILPILSVDVVGCVVLRVLLCNAGLMEGEEIVLYFATKFT